jgi:hypothetical protein
VHTEAWQKESLCYRLIEEAEKRGKSKREQSDFEIAARYFLREFPDMPNDTRGSILAPEEKCSRPSRRRRLQFAEPLHPA